MVTENLGIFEDDLEDVSDYGEDADELLPDGTKRRRVEEVTVSEETLQNAFRLRDAVMKAWLWYPEKLGVKIRS